MSAVRRVGVYGGTFDPPHLGHVGAARDFVAAVPLDELLIVPTYIPPHKRVTTHTDAKDRLAMCRAAFAGIPGATVSDMEIRRGGKSYTADTLAALSAPDRELYLLVGTDMFLTLGEWHCPERIFALATVCVVRRETEAETETEMTLRAADYRARYGARFLTVPHTAHPVSSSEVRDAIAAGTEWGHLLPAPVMEYIRQKGLYR